MSTMTIDRTGDTDVVEPITDTITAPEPTEATGTEGVEVDGEATSTETTANPVVNPETFGSEEEAAENARLYQECVNLLRDQLLGETDRNLALGHKVWKICEFQRTHCPSFEDKDVLRVCANIWSTVAREISLPEKNNLDRCLAFYLFRQTVAEQFKLDMAPKKAEGQARKPVLPFTVFDRHILPTALVFDRGGLGLEVKVKWFAWLGELLVDILELGKKFSRAKLDERMKAERKRQSDEGKTPEQLDREAKQADRSGRKAKRETIKRGFSKAVESAVGDELFTASQMVAELVSAMQAAEMRDIPAIGGVDPSTMRIEDIDSMVGVMAHFRRVDVMLRFQQKLSAEIARIQGS